MNYDYNVHLVVKNDTKSYQMLLLFHEELFETIPNGMRDGTVMTIGGQGGSNPLGQPVTEAPPGGGGIAHQRIEETIAAVA